MSMTTSESILLSPQSINYNKSIKCYFLAEIVAANSDSKFAVIQTAKYFKVNHYVDFHIKKGNR